MRSDAAETEREIHSLAARRLVYQLLARAYRRELDEEFLERLGAAQVLATAQGFSPRLEIDELRVTGRTRIDGLAVEFCRLFVGPGPRVSPCESIHRAEPGNAGRFWGDATIEVKGLIEALGLRYADDFHEMPDHISVEFELMDRLLGAEAEALESGDAEMRGNARAAQEVFFGRHLGVWTPHFCDRLETATDEPFYAAMAVLTRDFLTHESEIYAASPCAAGQRP